MGTYMFPRGVIFYIYLILDSEKTKHTTMISVKFSTQEFIFNYKQIDLKMYIYIQYDFT